MLSIQERIVEVSEERIQQDIVDEIVERPRTPREQIVDMPIFHVIEETMVARDVSEKRAWDRVASVQQGVDKLATWSMPVPRSTSGGASPNRSLGVCASHSGTKGRSRAGHSIPQVGVILDAP